MIYLFYETFEKANLSQLQILDNRKQLGYLDITNAGNGETLTPQVTENWAIPIEFNQMWGIPKPDNEFMENVELPTIEQEFAIIEGVNND